MTKKHNHERYKVTRTVNDLDAIITSQKTVSESQEHHHHQRRMDGVLEIVR